MPVIARSPEGQVTSLWGTALIRGADGKLRLLKVGDIVRQGDQILTTQDGIVQIANGEVAEAEQTAETRKAPQGDEIDQVIADLNAGDRQAAPAAGLAGGGDGSLEAGLRVDRINEGIGSFQIAGGATEPDLRRVDVAGGTTTAPEDQVVRPPALTAPSSAISAAEEGAPANLGLTAPAGNGSIRVDQVPTIGEIRTADGTLVTPGTVLTPADLPGLVYVPPSEYDGVVPAGNFGYTLTVDGQTVTGGTTITLNPVNDAPVATPASATGNEDGTLPLSLGGTDVDGTIVGVTVTRLPAGGSLFLADGVTPVGVGQTLTPAQATTLLYKPGADFNGDQTLLFTVTDNGGLTSAPAAASLTVVAVNDAPVASIGSGGSGNEDTPIAVNLGGTDADGTVTAVTVTRLPGNGTLFLADGVTPVATGTTLTPAQAAGLVFVPATNFNGSVTIGFTVTDNDGAVSRPVNAVVTVNPVNDAPVAQADSATLAEDSVATGNVLGNDGDVDGPALSVTGFTFGGTSFAAGSTAIVGGVGTLTVNADGSWTFTPAANFNGPVPAIQVTVSDGSLDSTSALSLTVTPVNDAPVASSSAITVAEESADTPLGLTAPSDLDGDALTITVTGLPSVGTITLADGTPVVNGQVLTAAQLAGLQFDAPADLLAATSTSFTYAVSDGTVTVNAGTTISVTPINDAPVASSSTITVAEESSDSPLGLSAPTDIDGDALTITVTGLPSIGTITLADGTPVVNGQVLTAAQLAGLQFDAPADLLAATSTSFTYAVSDGTVTVNAGTTITVTPVNDAPVASSSTITVAEESSDSPLGLTAPTDIDGDALTITVTGLPSVGTITLADGTPVVNGQVLSAAQLAGLQFDAPADLLAATSTSFTYSVSDGSVTVNAGTTITVTPVNDNPVAVGDSAVATEDLALTLPAATLLANDSDVDGDTLSIVSVQGAVNGTVALVGGNVVFTPAAGYNGPASFTYTVSDGRGGSSIATVNLTVSPDNDAPVAVGDIVGPVDEDTSLTISPATLLGNDSDPDGDSLGILSVQGAVNGTVALVGGNVVFTPNPNYNGPASFTYTVSDGNGGTATATVNLTVNPVNDAPVANPDSFTTAEDAPISISLPSLLANDTDVDGDPLSVFAAGSAVNGTLSVVGGNLVFTPNANYSGPASFSYSITDGRGGVSTSTVNINVTPLNDAPAASSSTITVAEESANTPLGLTPPVDVDGDAMTITVTGLPSVGTVTLADGTPVTNGQVLTAAQLAGLQFDAPADLLTATSTSFTYTVSDGTVTVNAGTTINVNPVNDAPVANPDSFTTGEDTPLTISLPSLLANDTDIDGDALSVFAAGSAVNGTLSVVGGNLVFTPNANYSGPASFSYSITDGRGGVSTSTVNINVTPVNDAPAASSSTITVAEESANTPLGLSAPTDIDGDALTITVTGLPSVGTVTLADGTPVANGQVLTAAQLAGLQYDAPADLLASTSTSFTYSVSDGTATVNAGTTINVTPVNDAPVASNSTISVAEESANTPLGLTAPTDVDGNPLTITVTGLPAVGTVTLADGTPVTNGQVLTAAQLAGLQFDAPADLLASTSTSFTYSVSDGTVTVNAGTTISVTPVNDAPAAANDVASTAINTPLASIPVLANDTDVDGDALTVTAATLANPALGSVSINADGSLAFTPATNISGPVVINYTVGDGRGGFSSATLTVNVGANTPPQGADRTVSVTEDGSRSFSTADFGFSDADAGQSLAAVRIDVLPGAGTLLLNGNPVVAGTVVSAAQLAAGALVFVPAANANGTGYASFGFSVQDDVGSFDTSPNTITIDVSPVNDAPVASSSAISVAEESSNTPLGLTAPTDVDGNALTITVTGLPSVGTVTLADGTPVVNGQVLTAAQLAGLQFDAPADLLASTSTSFTYSVSDGTVTVNAGTTISVTPVNDAPVASSSTITVAEQSANTPLGLTAPTDVDGNSLTITVTGLPTVGTVTLADGTPVVNGQVLTAAQLAGLQFDAPADLLAATSTSFTYSVSDGSVTVNAGTTISVTPVNDAPVASSSTITVAEESANTPLGLTAPTDVDGNPLTITVTGLPAVGTVTLADGTPVTNGQVLTAAQLAGLQFDAPADLLASASTSFTYSVSDGTVTVNAGATISVTPVNDAPVASSSTITVAEESANSPLGLTAPTDVDGNPLTITVTGLPSVGTITLADGTPVTNGQVLTAAQLAGLQFDAPADLLASTSTSFTYSVSDGSVTINAGTTISVTPVNDAPVASSSTITVAEESANTPLGLTAPTDVDGNALTITVTGLPSLGTVTLADGTPVVNGQVLTAAQLAGLQFDAPADLLASTNTSFTYSVSDGTVTVNAGTTISVTPVNDAPVASSSAITVTEESANTPLGLTAPTDVDGNPLTITVTGLPSVGSITLADGTPVTNGQVLTAAQLAGLQFDAPADLLASTSTSFTYSVSDGSVTVNAGTTIGVTPVNDAPVASSSAITVAEESANTPLGLTAPTDVDGNALTITVTGLPSVGNVTLADGTPVVNGQVLTAAQLAGLQFDAPADLLASTSTSFTYSVSDGTVTVNAGTTISVSPVNDAPVASSSTITVAEESANTPLGLTAPTDVDGNALTITVTGLPSVGTVTLADGTPVTNGQVLTAAQLAGLQFDAPADLLAATSTSFTYSVSDGSVTVNAGTTISVTPVNDAPVASSSTITVAEESANTPLGLTAPTDVDGNPLTITVTGLPAVGTVTLADGTPVTNGQVLTAAQLAGLQFDAPADLLASTSTSFTYSVSDGTVTVNAGTTISVTPVNDAPVASSSTITVAEESANTPLGLTAPSDVDGNALMITVTGLPSVGTITLADGTPVTNGQVLTAAQLAGLQFDAPADLLASTSTSFTYSVSDGTVTVNAGTTISVTPVNDAPVASSSTISVAEESANTPLGLTAPTDVDGNALTVTVTGLPSVGTITLADGTPVINGQVLTAAQLAGLQFDAPADLLASTSTSFTYSVSDGTVTVNAGTTISVMPVNDAPVASSSTISVAEESTNTPLGLTAPSDVDGNALTITVTGLPSVGTITLADGTPVTNGQVLTAAQLAGLQFDAPADLLASTSTSFTYSVSDGSVTVNAGTTISVTPVNDAPAASSSTITVAEDSANTPLGLSAPTDIDGDALTITVTGLPSVGTVTLADGTPVTNGQVLTAAQLAGLQFDAPADLLASTSTSFTYSVSDGTVTVNAGTTISVTPVNDAPVASSSTITVAEESANTPLGLTAPTDVDGNPLTITVTGLPSVGTVTLADGTPVTNGQVLTAAQLAGLQFDAPADLLASTSTSFTYAVSDGTVTVNGGTTISVTPVNDAPVASSSTITVAEESANTPLGLTAPTDVDGNALTITVTGLPSVGTITLADGTPVTNGQALTAAQLAGLQFDAPADLLASTSTSFTYSVSDGTVTVNAGTTISVTPVNDAPVASSSTITVAEESANTPLGLTAPTDVDGNPLTITVTGLPSVGTVTLADGTPVTNGQVLTAAQLAGLQFDAPADLLASTSTSFTYSVSDGTITVNAGTTISVTPVNDAPVASSSTITVAEESANTPLGLTAPTDVDGNSLTITVTGLPSVGTVTLADGTPVSNGQVLTAAQLAGLQFDAPADLLASTSTSFTYSVSDGTVTVNAGTTISVTPVNDAPVATNDVAVTAINTPLLFIPVLANDTDVDGDPLTVTAATMANPALGSVAINPDGTLSFTPATNVSGPVVINYTIDDGNGRTSVATLTVNVGANTSPEGADTTISVAEDGSRAFSAADFGFSDADAGQSLAAVRIDVLPGAGTLLLNGSPIAAGTVVSAAQLAAGALVFVPAADANGNAYANFSFSVQDNGGAFDASPNTITINVTPVNDAPVASSSTISVAEESANTPLGLTAPTDVDGNPLTITVTGLPSVGTITLADGTPVTNGQVLTAAQLAGLQFDAPADLLASTSTSFTYSVSDGTVTVNAGTTISVTPVNDVPVASSSTITVAEESANTPLGLTAPTDVDGNPLTITVTGLPSVGTITLADGTPVTNGQVLTAAQLAGLQFDAPADLLASTTTSFTYSVSDGTVTVNAGTTISVTPVNDAPVASSSTISVAEESANTPLGLTAPTDVDGNPLTITVTGLPSVGTITLADGTPVVNGQVLTAAQLAGLQFDAPADLLASTSTSFTYSVSDGTVTVNAGTTISVTPVNDAPVASSSTITVAEESANTPLGLTAPTDVDGNALTITVTGLPSVGTITLADGTPVVNSQVLTAAQLAGLQFDAPADLLASTSTSFTYSVSDGTVTVNAGTTISVTPVNDAPVASSSTITVAEESTNTPLGLTGPTDVDGNSLTITVTGLPSVGTITLADGTPVTNGQVLTAAQLAGLQFDAPADLLSPTSTSFTYSVSDGTVTVNAGTTIGVTPVNDAPVASSSTISVAEESANTPLGLTAPTDVDGNPLTITVTGLPSVGTVTLADGTPVTNGQVLTAAQLAGLQFDAPADLLASTSTSFTYSVSDGTVSVNAGTTISVTPVNDAPVAQPASFTVAEDAAVVTGAVTATDVDAGATFTYALNGAAPAGLVFNTNGSYSFDPSNAAYQSLAFGQSQVITVPYTVTDNAGATSTANLVITVTGTNDAPVAQAAAFSVAEDAVVVTGSVTATDVDSGATRTFALNGAAPAGLVFNTNGSYSFDPSNAAYQSLRAGQSTVITVPYTVTDDRGATSTANLVITVTGTNDAPVAVADSGSLAENATLTTTAASGVLANDTDIDSGDSRTVSAISFGASNGTVGSALNGTYGALTLNADGSYSYVANRPAAEALTAGQVVTESFTYTVRDGSGATSQATITFTITGANDAPTITGPLTGAVQEDTTLSTGGTLVITDADAGQSSFVAQTATAGTYGSFAITAGGVWTYTLNNTAANVQALAGGSAVTEDFIVRSADGTERTITVTVNGTNDAPVAQARSFTVAEDAAVVTGAVTATDVDTGSTLSYALNGAAPAGLTFNADGTYSFNPANAAYQSLGFGQQQVITVPYTVTDNAGATSTANLVITVTGTNDSPVANANTGPATEDTVLTIVPATLLANDTDVDSGDTLTITSVQGAVNGSVVLSGGNIVFTPAANYSGQASFTYTVTDSRGATSTATVTLNVAAVADAPTLVINGTSSTGGSSTPAVLPAATGLVRDFFEDIASVSTANAGNIGTVETAVEAATRTSTSIVTDISIPDLNVDDAYRYTGFIYLTAGQTYQITGSRDDTLAVKLGGSTVYGVGYNNWGAFTATGFTPSVSGYYSLEVIAYNGDGVGTLDINMSVNGGASVDLNTSNFRIYANASDFSSSPTVAGPLVPNGDGGYYPGGAGGNEDTAIRLGNISASLNDNDGSETLSLRIGSIPVGAVISDGTNSFTATAGNTSVLVTGWSLNNLTITPPLHFAGTINLSVTATATEATGPTASTTGTLPVLVTAVADAPVVAGDTVIVSIAQENVAATVNFPILATRVDVDGSETLRVLVSGVPTGITFSAGTNNGSGVWEFTQAQLDGLTMTLPANTVTSGTVLTVTAVTRETSTGAEATDSSTITLISDSTDGASSTGTNAANTINGNNADNFINALGGNDTVSGGGGEDLVRGGDGNDSINGGAASDALWGDAGADIIIGGTESDLIRGGAGSDTMTGGTTAGAADGTADVFAWSLADAGTAGAPAVDTITDFNVGAVSAGGDVLDLRDLLSGDVLGPGNTAGNLANFLDFAVSGSGASASTTIRISSTGQFTDGNYAASATDQTIVLQGVDLPTSLGLGSGATDAQIVQELLSRGKLIVDSTGG